MRHAQLKVTSKEEKIGLREYLTVKQEKRIGLMGTRQ